MNMQSDSPFTSEIDVLNYALTLEHLEATFYRQAVEMFPADAYLAAGFQTSVRDRIVAIAEHEKQHVDALSAVIGQLGGKPVQEGSYDFGYSDLTGFFQTAAAIEAVGVAAYTGAAQYLIENDDLLSAALTIHGVEARHAAYLNLLVGASPFPEAVDAPRTPADILESAGPFIAG